MRIELPDVREAIITHDSIDKPALVVLDGNGIGLGVLQDLKRRGLNNILPGGAMERSNTEDLKTKRFRWALLDLYDGWVRVPNQMQGLDSLLSELALFPDGKCDDQVDALCLIAACRRKVISMARLNADRYRRWAHAAPALVTEPPSDGPRPRRPRKYYLD
jgi:phage terminase large subunit-like protein